MGNVSRADRERIRDKLLTTFREISAQVR